MPRPDRHDEIEINFLDRGTLTYLVRRAADHGAGPPGDGILGRGSAPDRRLRQAQLLLRRDGAVRLGAAVGAARTRAHGADARTNRRRHERHACAARSPAVRAVAPGRRRAFRSLKREIVVLELRARLLRLAAFGARHRTLRRPAPRKPTASRQQTNLEKAESMACFVARNYTSRIQIKDIAECVGSAPRLRGDAVPQDIRHDAQRAHHAASHRACPAAIVTSSERVVNIAHDSGFESLSRFNRAFKQLAGMTPRQYRKTLGQPAGSNGG